MEKEKYIHELNIGNVKLKNNVLVAPMAGITDEAFRYITNKIGRPGYIANEMYSSNAIKYRDKKTLKMITSYEGENPRVLQIFGSDPEIMAEAAKFIEPYADIIDINAGCPMPKITKTGAGAGLLKDLDNLEKIVQSVVNAVSIPVTLKTRIGYGENITIFDVLEIAEQNGIALLSIHGRKLEQIYSGKVDTKILAEVTKKAKIPIIVNGGIFSLEDAKKLLDETKASGIMIARGAIGNPWLVKDIVNWETKEVTKKEKIDALIMHYEYLSKIKGEEVASKEIRKYICYYTKGFSNASNIRKNIVNIVDKNTFYTQVEELEKE